MHVNANRLFATLRVTQKNYQLSIINYYEERNLAENHPHRHHDSDGYRHYIWCYILHVASAETATPKTQPATRNFATLAVLFRKSHQAY